MESYKVLAGKHVERGPNGKLVVWKKGEVIKTASDLCKRFPEKFEKLHPADAKSAAEKLYEAREEAKKKLKELAEAELPPEPEDDGVSQEEGAEEEEKPDLGTDVTAKFQMVHDDGRLTVHYDGENYTVAQNGDAVGGPFEGKAGVVEFFKKWKKANKE